MRRPGSSSRWPRWAGPTRPSAASPCSIRSTMRSTRTPPSATGSNPMSWRPTSIRRPTRRGRGGWTWYTGSAGWLYRAAVESILGIRKEGDRLIVDASAAQPLGRLFGHAAAFRRSLSRSQRVEREATGDAEAASIEIERRRQTAAGIPFDDRCAETRSAVARTIVEHRSRRYAVRCTFTQSWATRHDFAATSPFFLISQSVSRSRDVTAVAVFCSISEPER